MKVSLSFGVIILILAHDPCFSQIEYNDADWGVHPMNYSRVGTAGWQFLKLPTNAKTASMGGVVSAISYGNANAVFTNPASLVDVKNYDFATSRMNWIADIGYQSFSLVKNMSEYGSFGLSFVYLDYGSMERTENLPSYDALGKNIGTIPVLDNLGTFSAADMAMGFSYSRQITNKLQVGGTIKYLQQRLDDATTTTWSLDIGTLYYTGFHSLRISFVGKNFGPDAQFGTYNERIQVQPIKIKLPMILVFGAAYDILGGNDDHPHHVVAAIEYVNPNDGREKFNMGAEYSFMKILSLRAGYRVNYDEEGLTLGAGVNYEVIELNIRIDYAYISVGIFKQVHMFTIGMSF